MMTIETSEDFAEAYPVLTYVQADRLCREHETSVAEYLLDCQPVRPLAGSVFTSDLLGWLGY